MAWRWPELLPWKRSEVPGGAGVRERHEDVRRVTANSGVALTHAGEHPVDGAALLPSDAAPVSSGTHGGVDFLHEPTRQRGHETRTVTGF